MTKFGHTADGALVACHVRRSPGAIWGIPLSVILEDVLIQTVYRHTYYRHDIKQALGNRIESANMVIGTRSNHCERGLSVFGGLFNRNSALRTTTTLRSLLQPWESVAFFRVLFSRTLEGTVGLSISRPPEGRAGNVKCLFGFFFFGVPVTGVVCERDFFPNLDRLDPPACLAGCLGSVRMLPVSMGRFQIDYCSYLPTSRATALGANP